MKSFKGKTSFCFSTLEDQDINFLNLLDISKYYRLLGLTRPIWSVVDPGFTKGGGGIK